MPGAWAELRLRRASDRRFLLGALLLVVFATVGYWRNAISLRLLPDPRMNQQLERAQSALRHGRLSSADGSGARELFESVLATDPDQMQARDGLVQVRNAAILRATRALAAHRLQEARKQLELAQALSAPAVQLQALRSRLRDLEEASADTAGLLAQAAAPGIGDDAALALLDRVLQLEADNRVALQGRDELLSAWLIKAEALLAADKLDAARELVDKVIAEDPAQVDLPPIRAKLGEALARAQRGSDREFQAAHAAEAAGRLDEAARIYLRLARSGVDVARARESLHRLAVAAARDAAKQAADFQFKRAEALLAKARQWSPQADEIGVAQQRLEQSRQAQGRLPVIPASGDRARLPALLAGVEQAMARGDFMTPPGTSAWDQLRIASALAPRSASVRKLQVEFSRQSRECFEQAMAAGHLKRAQACLEANLAQDPAALGATDARRRLAERWLAYADERIGASDYAEAERAIGFARRWQPSNPAIKSSSARLRRARGGSG